MKTTSTLFTVLGILAASTAGPAAAKDDPLQFVHLLQSEGYADVAIDYLDQLKADTSTPKEVLDLWELEMSKSKKLAVPYAYDGSQAKQWLDESKALLEQFIKANPDRPEAIQEAARASEEKALRGQYAVQRAIFATDKAEAAKLRGEARTLFEEIRPRFVQALKSSQRHLASLRAPRTKKEKEKFDGAKYMVGENRLTVAMVDFYLAQTLEAGAERNAALGKLIKAFDAIYQENRDANVGFPVLGWRAHFWHGRILQELGQPSEARAIYEEVAACDERNIEEVGESRISTRVRALKKTGLEDFFADVEQYYLQTLFQLSKKEYGEEVKSWREAHKANSEKCSGYQALTFEYAKNLLAIAAQAKSDTQKEALKREAIRLLGEMKRIESPYQGEAIKLVRQINPNGLAEEGFEDKVIDGDAALEKRDWDTAAKCYEKAVEAATAKTDKVRLAAVKNTVVGCYHNMAMQLYQQRKTDEAMAMAKKALGKTAYLDTKAAPGVAVFLLNLQYYQYLAAPEGTQPEKAAKAEMLTKLAKTANGILKTRDWAAKEEGDAARIILLRKALEEKMTAEADKILSEINPASKEYPKALTVMGFAHWSKYRAAKKQIEADQAGKAAVDADKIAKRDADRKAAVEYTAKAVKVLDTPRPADAPLPDSLRESQLLLAEIYSEGSEWPQAVVLYQPLVDEIIKSTNKPFDENALRIFNGAAQALLQTGEIEKITTLGEKFLELGPDQGQVNLMIMNLARRLETKRKDALSEGDAGDPNGAGAAKLKALTDITEKVMVSLSKREHISPPSMVWIVKTSNNLGTDEAKAAAAALIEKIISKADVDQDFDKEISKQKPALQSMGAIIEAECGDYAKAKELIDRLVQTYPKVLDMRISRAKIITAWAAKDASKYKDAIGAWEWLRTRLEKAAGTSDKDDPTKVNPKYEVILNEADCFCKMSQKSKSKDDAKQGMNLISPYLNLDANIRTPNDAYKEISVRYYQLGRKLADILGVVAPVRPKAKRATGK